MKVFDFKDRLDEELHDVRSVSDARAQVARRVRARARRRKLTAIPAALIITVAIIVPLARLISPTTRSPAGVDPMACAWAVTPTPSVSLESRGNFLNDVAAVGPDDVWAVGSAYLRGETGDSRPLIVHWDGSSWTVVPTPAAEGLLTSVAAVSTDDVWAVGSSSTPTGLVLHWDGDRWSVIEAADPGTRYWGFRGATAIGPDDVWAVGWTATGGSGQPLTQHWDGASWSVVPVPPVAPSPLTGQPYASFDAIAANQTDDVWAVGERTNVSPAGASNFLTAHWDGAVWTTFPVPDIPTQDGEVFNHLFDVAVAADGEALAVGSYSAEPGTGYGDLPADHEWDGTSWDPVPGPPSDLPPSAVAQVGGVWLTVASGVPSFVEGQRDLAGELSIWDGTWEVRPLPGTEGASLSGLSVSGTELWVVGSAPRDDGFNSMLAGRCS